MWPDDSCERDRSPLAARALRCRRNPPRVARRHGPTASFLLARLRGLVRDPLFVKSSGGMTPTPKTLTLYGEIRRGLDILDGAFDPTTFDPARSMRQFRLAMIDIGEL